VLGPRFVLLSLAFRASFDRATKAPGEILGAFVHGAAQHPAGVRRCGSSPRGPRARRLPRSRPWPHD
jgi:hypothetical protein